MLSQSATYDEAVSEYNWFKYTGQRGKEVSERTHKRMIREGDIFGVKSLKSGSRFTLIFPDMPHINFPLDKKNGNQLLERATKLRKLPDIVQRDGRAKARGVKTTERQLQRKNFDNARFAPRTVPNEYKNGIDFSNYQWRIVPEMSLTITHTKGKEILKKNEMIGMRYIRDAKGGVIINEKGMYLKLTPENYDKVVTETLVMPIQDWPNGSLSDADVKAYRADSKKMKHRTQVEMREAARLEQRAEKLAKEVSARDAKRAQKENSRAEQERYDEMKEKIKRGEMEAPSAKPRTFDTEENAIPTVRLRNQIKSILAEEELEEDLDEVLDMDVVEEEQAEEDDMFAPLEDILSARPFASDNMGIDSVIGSMFGDGDDSDSVESDFDLSDVEEEPEDEEEEAPPSKVKKKSKVAKPTPEEAEEDSEDDTESEDDSEDDAELEDNSEETDDEDSEEEDDSEETDDEETDEEDPEEEDDSEEETDEEDDTDSEEETDEDPDAEETDDEEEEDPDADEEDPDAEEADSEDEEADIDETDADEVDEDVLNAEQEAAELAKKQATENKGTPEKLANPEAGDIVVFKADEKLKREWVVLREAPHKSSDSIIVYTLYDITNSPDEVRQVRINKARKQSLFDIAEHVKDMKPTLFARVYDMSEEFEVNKEPIVS